MILLYLLTDAYEDGKHSFRHFDDFGKMLSCLDQTDFRVVITSWNHILIDKDRVVLDYAIERVNGEFITHDRLEIEPSLILDECPGTEERVAGCLHIRKLQQTFWKKSYFTYHPLIATIGKCQLEQYFLDAEKRGILAHRPRTWVCPTLSETREKLLYLLPMNSPLIVKSDMGTRSEAVYVVSDKNVDEVLAKLSENPYVIQEYVSDSVLFEGKKADLRVNVAVYSWKTLEFNVFRAAKMRVARDVFSPETVMDPHVGITARATYELAHLDEEIWQHIEADIRVMLKAIVCGAGLDHSTDIHQVISLIGVDILLQKKGDTIQPLILEINPKPGKLTVSHSEKELIDDLLGSYVDFFQTCYARINSLSS